MATIALTAFIESKLTPTEINDCMVPPDSGQTIEMRYSHAYQPMKWTMEQCMIAYSVCDWIYALVEDTHLEGYVKIDNISITQSGNMILRAPTKEDRENDTRTYEEKRSDDYYNAAQAMLAIHQQVICQSDRDATNLYIANRPGYLSERRAWQYFLESVLEHADCKSSVTTVQQAYDTMTRR